MHAKKNVIKTKKKHTFVLLVRKYVMMTETYEKRPENIYERILLSL